MASKTRAARPRSNTERGRASRFRARVRAGTATREQKAFLREYDRDVRSYKRVKLGRATKTRKTYYGDARALSTTLARWLGGAGIVGKTEGGYRADGSSAQAEVANPATRIPETPPDLREKLAAGRGMSARVLFTQKGTRKKRWVTVLAYTDNPKLAGADFWTALGEAFDGYVITSVEAVAVIVGPA